MNKERQDIDINANLENSESILLESHSLQNLHELQGDSISIEEYYNSILSNAGNENAMEEYKKHYDEVTEKFLEKTMLHGEDIPFLFFATMLQCARSFGMDKFTRKEKANTKGGREDKLHDFQSNILGKFGSGEGAQAELMYASLEEIISLRGVPYDATAYAGDKLGLFKGTNHRFATLGHDPVMGLIFGTANILTNTITVKRKILPATYHVIYDAQLKNPQISTITSTAEMLTKAYERLENDKKSVAAALIKQLIHIASDMYTPCGIALPGAHIILSNENVDKLTSYISTGDLIKAEASGGLAMLINAIVAGVHGSKLIFEDDSEKYDRELYQARTRKIILYSNVIATSSNILATALPKSKVTIDWGGMAVTIYRLFSDPRFIIDLEREFIDSGLNNIYDKKYENVALYYE